MCAPLSIWILAASLLQDAGAERAAARFELPPGGAAARIVALEARTVPALTPADLGRREQVPALAADAWSRPTAWEEWSQLVAAESRERKSDPERRARLALLALAQGRDEDAWQHLATCADPRWIAAVLPRFLPGVPAGSAAGVGGGPGVLPDGVVLSPALPPFSEAAPREGRIDRRAMSIRGFAVGDALVSLAVSVEAEGVQVEVRHVAGGSAKLAVSIPCSPGYTFADEYVDWYRQDLRGVPHAIEVRPGEAEHTFYGRFEPRPLTGRARAPRVIPGSVREGGLWLVLAEGDPGRALADVVARTITERQFGFTVGVRTSGTPPPSWSGVDFALVDRFARADELSWLAGSIERFALGDGAR